MTHAIPVPRHSLRIGALFAALLLCWMSFFGISSAQAHDELVSSTPASGDVLTSAPHQLVLTFSGNIKEIGTILELTDATGRNVDTTFKIDHRDVDVTPAEILPNGTYTLVARVVSSDGHPIDKTITFQVKDPAGAAAASATATATAPASASPVANPAPSPQPSAEAGDGTAAVAGMPAALVWALAGLAGVGLVVLVLLKVRGQTK